MTPAAFVARYHALALDAAGRTGVSAGAILCQWAVESGWGSSPLAVTWHNLAGVRWYGRPAQARQVGGVPGKIGTGFGAYATLDTFAADYAHVLNLPYYAAVRAAIGVPDELRALGASPWDAGHYRAGGVRGGSLLVVWGTIGTILAGHGGFGVGFLTAHGVELYTYSGGAMHAHAHDQNVDGAMVSPVATIGGVGYRHLRSGPHAGYYVAAGRGSFRPI